MTRQKFFLLLLAMLLISLSWFGILTANSGLTVRSLTKDRVPLIYLAPEKAQNIPGILIAHGFAGSKQLMLGYGYVLARAGYAVMLWDFTAHGANPSSFENSFDESSLQADLQVAEAALREQSEVDGSRLALLGHSMGSAAVLNAAIARPDRYGATIAISPTDAAVTPQAPRNLQLQAGRWEPRFVENAKRLLDRAGGENPNLEMGNGRSLSVVPYAEHITILFRDASHQSAKNWLDATFGVQKSSMVRDRRFFWYVLHLLSGLLALGTIATLVRFPKTPIPLSRTKKKVGAIVAPLGAIVGISLLAQMMDIAEIGGLLVGGAIAIWFAIAGLVWLAILGRISRPTLRSWGVGLGLFLLLWMDFGVMAQVTWLQWWLIPARFQVWIPLSVACFPWFFASGLVQQDLDGKQRFVWWLGQSTALVLGFFLTIAIVPNLGFIVLLLPLFPIVMGILSVPAATLNEPWSYAVGSSLFFGWTLATAFPLA